MSWALIGLATVTVVVWAAFALEMVAGRRWLPRLAAASPPGTTPSVSVVIAARNEAAAIGAALDSVLALDYPALEVVVVDDRSADGTGEILARAAVADPRLTVLHVGEVPPGWLGKTWALELGARRSTGELILFTDADVTFEPTVVSRAVSTLEKRELDHLTAAGDVRTSSLILELFVAAFALSFTGYFRPWRAADPRRPEAVGVGAFNLVRRSAWERAGGHRSIALALDDDLRLGAALKRSGARQAFADAGRLISLEWYPSLPAAVQGLEKNSLAAVGGSWLLLVGGSIGQLLMIAWPYVAVLVTAGPVRWLNAAAVALIGGVHIYLTRGSSLRPWTALALPLGVVLLVFTMLRAALLTKLRGGVSWRGTFYSNEYLRRQEPRDPSDPSDPAGP